MDIGTHHGCRNEWKYFCWCFSLLVRGVSEKLWASAAKGSGKPVGHFRSLRGEMWSARVHERENENRVLLLLLLVPLDVKLSFQLFFSNSRLLLFIPQRAELCAAVKDSRTQHCNLGPTFWCQDVKSAMMCGVSSLCLSLCHSSSYLLKDISRVPTRRTSPTMRFCGCGLERGSSQDPPLRILTGALTGAQKVLQQREY